ncbi:MAG: M48 family metalloprotease [Sulfuritalea sp.]|nr:M48 family metalloprotease [Polynucleobacter sp.]MCF8187796.1 M48 family metalloprotease [Sulfuritalea sp.]
MPLASFTMTCRRYLRPSRSVLSPLFLFPFLFTFLGACNQVPLNSTTSTSPSTPASPSVSQNSPSKVNGASSITIRDPVIDTLLERQEHIYRIAAPLIIKNAVLCRTQARPLLGFTAKNQYSYPPELSVAARQSLGLDERLQVMQILDGSGAMRAGLKRGDILQTIQDITIPTGPQAEPEAARMLSPILKNLTEINITVIRQNQPITVNVPLTLACAFAIDVGNTQNVNAYADGRRILLTRGLLDWLSTDEDVAVIIAREIAHNVLQHAKQLQQMATLSIVIDNLLLFKPDQVAANSSNGIKITPEKMDQDADRLALFMLARAGYDLASFTRVMQKLAQIPNASQANTYPALHPWTEGRQSVIQSTMKEIRQKQSAKKALVP